MNLKFIIRKNRSVDGTMPIQMQITIDGERIFFSTGQKIEIENWDEKFGRALGKAPKVKILNEILDKMNVDAHRAFNEMKHLDEEITAETLRKKLAGEEKYMRKKLIEVTQIYNAHTSKLIGIELNQHTWERYKAYAQKLSDFMKKQYKTNDIYIHQLKYSFIVEYDYYLKTEVKIHQNTIVKYIQYLNRVMEFAVNHEWADKNVFQNYKVSIKESKREYLTGEELQRIMEKEIKITRLQEVRDCFVFCCFTGYAYKDAENLTPEHIVTGINGKKWIYTSRQKTENVSNVPLLEPALEIIEKYKEHPVCVNRNRLLPMKSNQKLNSYLKELADICDITKPITMHIARHTFATTVLLANGVSMEATSKMLGHSSIKTTQIYGKIVETRVGAEMDNLSEKLFAPKKNGIRKAK
ncbi:MAG: site-specific integrase [Saprospiraceae bacterium]|nr:site-specific integrase [Saprospiraceae bacterium]MBK8372370.1 site-specific integrase [Saprospiraceae bacterium]MBK8548066.1 site-specific integrase [Saprospiraceae bacterium]